MASKKKMTMGIDRGESRFFPGSSGEDRPRGDVRRLCKRPGWTWSCSIRSKVSTAPWKLMKKPNACADLFKSRRRKPSTASSSRCQTLAMSAPLPTRCVWPACKFLCSSRLRRIRRGKWAITHRRDSFCGKMSACNNLRQYGIPYSLTTLHTEAPDSAEFAKDLEWFAAVCRVVKGLRNLRIGALGARPTAFNTVRYSEKLLEASGISVETLDL